MKAQKNSIFTSLGTLLICSKIRDSRYSKKAISPVVAMALLLVVAVVAAVGFQSWYSNFQSTVFSDVEIQGNSGIGGTLKIEQLVGETLYVVNNIKDNLSINKLRVGDFECSIPDNLTLGMNAINISNCINSSSGRSEILLVTENKVVEKQVYVQDSSLAESSLPPVPSDPSCYLSSNVNTIGTLPECDGMLIVNHTMLYAASGNNLINGGEDFYIEFDGTNYTFGNSTENLFTGQVIDMSYLFYYETDFNADIDYWETKNVINMEYMFGHATSFNQPLDNFNTSKVNNMDNMFAYATIFNQPLNFDTSNVIDMFEMFNYATNFDGTLNFNTSKVTNMAEMFYFATNFNQPVNFDTSSVTDMTNMFDSASTFDQPLDFNTSTVFSMHYMFSDATNFNQDLSSWCVPEIGTLPSNFDTGSGSSVPNRPVWGTCPLPDPSCYIVENVNTIGSLPECAGMLIVDNTMLYNAKNANPINGGEDFYIEFGGTNYTFGNSTYNIFTGQVTDMSNLFSWKTSFNAEIGYWETSNVESMDWMFDYASAFNQPLTNFNTSKVTKMEDMFYYASSFTHPVDHFNTSLVTDMEEMFSGASSFNHPLNFDTSNVLNMNKMFQDATIFNQDLSSWCVSSIGSLPSLFDTGSALSTPNRPVWGTCP